MGSSSFQGGPTVGHAAVYRRDVGSIPSPGALDEDVQRCAAMGISNDGDDAEALFCQVTGALRQGRTARADALLGPWPIEVKKVSSGTLNQVRPIRFLTVVARDTSSSVWFVLPAERILTAAIRKPRGQHTENALECCTLSLSDFSDCLVHERFLRETVILVAERSSLLTGVSSLLQQQLDELNAIAARQRAAVADRLELGLSRLTFDWKHEWHRSSVAEQGTVSSEEGGSIPPGVAACRCVFGSGAHS